MKKLSFFHAAMATLFLAASFTACSSDDENDTPTPPPDPVVVPCHYDLTVTVGNHGGMSKDKSHITLSLDTLSNAKTIDFKGKGAEITEYTMESIVKGKYMYQVPVSSDRFSKLQFKDNKMVVVQEQPFKVNTYKARNYTHAWLNDSVLVIMASNGDNDKIIWTKLNANNMTIIDEGTLTVDVPLTEDGKKYTVLTTSGLLAYRQSDNKLFYFYYWKTAKRKGITEPFFHIAVIDPTTMKVEKDIINAEAAQMQSSAYGELLQNTIFFDESGNLYLSAFNEVNGVNIGSLLRIKKGEYNFEADYNAFPGAKGKLLTVQYLSDGQVLAYSGDAEQGTSIEDMAYYYSIINLKNQTVTPLRYNNADIDYSSGSFSQRSVYNANDNKAYFGVNTASEQCVYVYDVKTMTVSKGITIAEGYYFDQIRLFENDSYVAK